MSAAELSTNAADAVYVINPNHKKNLTKSYRDYLQNTPHVVLHNRPSLSIAAERLTCLNNSGGMHLEPSPNTR